MAKLLILLALCVLPALIGADDTRPLATPYTVIGRVYCDTCGFGYENAKSTYIKGAVVKIECKNENGDIYFTSREGKTDAEGWYKIEVTQDHGESDCHAVLVSSPQIGCSKIQEGRDKATVILTNNNGIRSFDRFANNLGCVSDGASPQSVSGCSELASLYLQEDV